MRNAGIRDGFSSRRKVDSFLRPVRLHEAASGGSQDEVAGGTERAPGQSEAEEF